MINAKKIYKDYDAEVITYMTNLIKSLTKQYGVIADEWRVSLDLIAFNYDLIVKCQQDIKKNGFSVEDSRGRLSKNQCITIQNQAQSNLYKLMNSFGLNLLSKSRLKDTTDDDDTLDSLINE